jgi:hypothetical protein
MKDVGVLINNETKMTFQDRRDWCGGIFSALNR